MIGGSRLIAFLKIWVNALRTRILLTASIHSETMNPVIADGLTLKNKVQIVETAMQISENGLNLIKQFEGLRLDAYQDQGGVWTVGYGHTIGVSPDTRITEQEAVFLLKADLETVEKCIANCVSVNLTQNQYDALCSFVFNLGCIALRNSTLLRKLNAGDDTGAAEEFQRWNHDNGKVLADLTERRQKESELFMTYTPGLA